MIRGADGERVVAMDEFHLGPYMTVVGDGEMLTEIRLPLKHGGGSAHEKVERRAGDFAIAAASAAVWIDGGTIADVGIALSAVGPTTVDVTRAEELLRGATPSEELFDAGAARSRPRTARRAPTAAGRSTTSATSPACSPNARCAARPPARCNRRPDRWRSRSHQRHEVSRDVEPRTLLVHFIRDTPGLTGTHWGCDTSNCGACVVLMDGEPLKSCTTLAAMAEGHEIAHGRVARGRRRSWTRSSRASTRCTRCTAASARRG